MASIDVMRGDIEKELRRQKINIRQNVENNDPGGYWAEALASVAVGCWLVMFGTFAFLFRDMFF